MSSPDISPTIYSSDDEESVDNLGNDAQRSFDAPSTLLQRSFDAPWNANESLNVMEIKPSENKNSEEMKNKSLEDKNSSLYIFILIAFVVSNILFTIIQAFILKLTFSK